MMRYPSDVVDQVLGLGPEPIMADWVGAETACSHCARPIIDGDYYAKSDVGAFFSDTRDLSCTSRAICWRCVILRKKVMLNGLSACVITPDGIYPIFKDIHKAWLFETPPQPPYFVMHSSSTMQHLAWRSIATLDNRVIAVRFGPHQLLVNRQKVLDALAIADRINEGQKKWVSPLMLDRKSAEPWHGQLNPRATEFLSEDEITFFGNLGQGEKWALSYLMHSKRPVAEQPEPITQTLLDKL